MSWHLTKIVGVHLEIIRDGVSLVPAQLRDIKPPTEY